MDQLDLDLLVWTTDPSAEAGFMDRTTACSDWTQRVNVNSSC